MKTFVLIAWAMLLLVFTCASDSSFWVNGTVPSFHWSGWPDFHVLTKLDFSLDLMYNSGYVLRKIGHFTGFAVLAVLFYRRSKSTVMSILASIAFALLTELLQLYFGRDGRLYDVAIDSAGVLLGAIVVQIVNRIKFDRNLSNAN
ncbi:MULTISPECIES: VanZ family protein [Paenibacillus]|uniref:VanZ-like domain-containing protein n=1 Tax=Paenibacillus borealis TaxID=160799 RepID=A0ABX3HC05_PAEBO|nr:VanZ family protein [Paenibacillus borealis]OMD48017.1 hypothetical protein BSK56_11940 [Paenibacillus borealis]